MLYTYTGADAAEIIQLKVQILADYINVKELSDDELADELASNYEEASQIALTAEGQGLIHRTHINGKAILKKVLQFICNGLKSDDIQSKILDLILAALASVMPMAAISALVAKYLLKLFMKKGIDAMCVNVN